MFLNTRSFLFTGLVIAGLLAGLGGFLFFANVPGPGASTQDTLYQPAQHKELAANDIDRIIAERQALAPKPGKQLARGDVDSMTMSEERREAYERLSEETPKPEAEAPRVRPRAPAEVAGVVEALPAPSVDVQEADGKAKDELVDVATLRQAAEQGDAAAQFALAGRLETGDGVPTDKVEALKFYLLSERTVTAGLEADDARDAARATPVERLRAELSADEIAEAEKRAAAFEPAS